MEVLSPPFRLNCQRIQSNNYITILTNSISSKKAPDANLEETEKWVRETFTGPDVAQPPFNFVVIEKNGAKPDRIVGIVGVVFKSDPEVGYIIHPDVWGKGYATEASRRLLEAWNLPLREKENNAEAQDGGERVDGDILHAEIVKGNGGSARVLEKCGFEAVREFHDGGDQIVVFRMMRPS